MTSSTAPPSTRPPSAFLRLPGEIRNKICQYALTSATPIEHLPGYRTVCGPQFIDRSQDTPKGRSLQFNSLKLVCKQLHAETAGLEIQFNCTIFTPSAGYSKPAEQCFFDFVASMTLKKLDWLSTVIIATEVKCLGPSVRDLPNLPYLSALVAFAKHHPTTDVRYQFVNFQFSRDNLYSWLSFMYVGVALMIALKGMSISDAALGETFGGCQWVSVMYDRAEAWSKTWNIVGLLRGVKNFAVWPKGGEELVNYMESLEQNIRRSGLSKGMSDLWRSHTGTWFKEGIRGKE
jgi:hypothetical protein